jgi:uncharacterized protein (TIGR03492 family)
VKRLLVISNGIGEDSVGAEVIRRLPRGFATDAYPTLGDGRHYKGLRPIVGPRAKLPSEGSRIDRGTLVKDVAGGLLGTIGPALKFLRSVRGTYDRFLVIGDFVGVAACWLAGIRGIVYLDVYNTGYVRTYWPLERAVMRRTCRTVFCRSERLAASLRKAGIDARAAGNIMMDTIPEGEYDASRRRLRLKAVTLLPGSRDATVANFTLQIEALAALPEDLRPDVFVAVAEGIEPAELSKATGLFFHPASNREASDLGRLSGRGMHVNLARGALGPLVRQSDLVLSQAGTATIQSLGLGRPVITFYRDTDRMKRFTDENKLFGDARLLVPADVGTLSQTLGRLLGDRNELKRLGAIGTERIGGPGVINEIIAALDADTPRAPTATISPASST